MIKILVPLAVFDDKNYFQTHGVRTSYLKKIFSYEVEPVFLSPFTPIKLVEKYYKECSGVLMMGGGDINPLYYDEEIEEKTKIDDKNRDEIELFLAKSAVKDKKPFLGICRGMQVLNVAQNGTLTQHLPDKFPNEKHGISEGGNYSDLRNADCAHVITIEPNTKLEKILSKSEVTVPCGHHQCVNTIGTDLKAGAHSPIGVVESIEHIDSDYFCLGVQFHPEVYKDGELEPIFKKFI
jgi:gamma-glutamyl-gamma-aminobutyrate hydrolase PuuD